MRVKVVPKPRAGESRRKFIGRCMAYPDLKGKPPKQRAGECYGLWREAHPGDTEEKAVTVDALTAARNRLHDLVRKPLAGDTKKAEEPAKEDNLTAIRARLHAITRKSSSCGGDCGCVKCATTKKGATG